MKNYRVQDACWNCEHLIYFINLKKGIDTFECHCALQEGDTAPNGICDLYEKEAE